MSLAPHPHGGGGQFYHSTLNQPQNQWQLSHHCAKALGLQPHLTAPPLIHSSSCHFPPLEEWVDLLLVFTGKRELRLGFVVADWRLWWWCLISGSNTSKVVWPYGNADWRESCGQEPQASQNRMRLTSGSVTSSSRGSVLANRTRDKVNSVQLKPQAHSFCSCLCIQPSSWQRDRRSSRAVQFKVPSCKLRGDQLMDLFFFFFCLYLLLMKKMDCSWSIWLIPGYVLNGLCWLN